jgi:hypothetical protein
MIESGNIVKGYSNYHILEVFMKTKKWQKPLLIILERSKPEEAVLGNCKTTGLAGPKIGCPGSSCEKTAST